MTYCFKTNMFKFFKIATAVIFTLQCAQGKTLSSRISGGSEAPQGQYPYMVSLQYQNPVDNSTKHICGATIVNENWVLTAAGCINGPSFLDLHFIFSGSVDLESGGRLHFPIQVDVHEDYNFFVGANDIAAIKVDQPFDFSDASKEAPVSLPAAGYDTEEGTVATVIGWGQQTQNTETMQILQEVEIPTISDAICSPLTDAATQMCTGTTEGNVGTCYGDNGGPLLVDGVQVGIVSYSIACGTTQPSVFTQVSSYVDWIANHTAG